MEENKDFYQQNKKDEEIDLFHLWQIIKKEKAGFLIIFFVCILITGLITFLMPKTYQSSALLEIGMIKNELIEGPKDIAVLFDQPFFLKRLSKSFGMKEQDWTRLRKIISIHPTEKFLEIKARAKTPSQAKLFVDQTTVLILERHQKIFIEEKKVFEIEIKKIKENIQTSEEKISELEKEVNRLRFPRTTAEGLLAQSFISALTKEKENLHAFKQTFLDKERERKFNSYETRIESEAMVPIRPIKPDKKLNIILGIILGLFAGISYVFIAEFFEKNKTRI